MKVSTLEYCRTWKEEKGTWRSVRKSEMSKSPSSGLGHPPGGLPRLAGRSHTLQVGSYLDVAENGPQESYNDPCKLLDLESKAERLI